MRIFPDAGMFLPVFLFTMLFPVSGAAAEPSAYLPAGVAVAQSAQSEASRGSPSQTGSEAPVPPPSPDDLLGDPVRGEGSPVGERLRLLEPASLLGLTLSEAYSAFGVPESVFSYRGEESWQDDVVFFYPLRLYLFWFDDRVWQVRLDSRFPGRFMNCTMGMRKNDVLSVFGRPVRDDGEWLLFSLPDHGFPVLARFRFTNELLTDAYVYRGDF